MEVCRPVELLPSCLAACVFWLLMLFFFCRCIFFSPFNVDFYRVSDRLTAYRLRLQLFQTALVTVVGTKHVRTTSQTVVLCQNTKSDLYQDKIIAFIHPYHLTFQNINLAPELRTSLFIHRSYHFLPSLIQLHPLCPLLICCCLFSFSPHQPLPLIVFIFFLLPLLLHLFILLNIACHMPHFILYAMAVKLLASYIFHLSRNNCLMFLEA